MILAISIWYLIGFITYIYIIYSSGRLKVSDLFCMFFLSLLGPIFLFAIWYLDHGDKVIWERKRD